MNRLFIFSAALGVLLFGFVANPGATNALTVSLLTDESCVPGTTLEFSVYITEFSGETLEGYAIRLSYDTSILTNPSVVTAGTLSDGKKIEEGVPADGVGNYSIGVFSGLGANSDGVLIKVRFTVADSFTGTKSITFAGPGKQTLLFDGSFNPIAATYTDGSYM